MKKGLLILSWICLVIWCGVIFFFSHQNGVSSGGLSGKIIQIILDILRFDVTEEVFSSMQLIVRKLAHATEYAVLGSLAFNAFYRTINVKIRDIALFSIVFSVIYAISDEIHQLFVAGRVGSYKDCIIDSLGAVIGVFLCLLVVHFWAKRKAKLANK